MKQLLRSLALGGLGVPPVYAALQRRAWRGRPLTILCYHTLGADPEAMDAWTVLRASDFQDQINLLRQHYRIVSLDEALSSPDPGGKPLAVLTFDDGDLGLYTHLMPIVQREDLPVTIYIATSQIQSRVPYWFDRVMNALQQPGGCRIDLTEQGLGVYDIPPGQGSPLTPARWLAISDLLERLKAVPPDRREMLAAEVTRQAGTPPAGITPLQPLSLGQLQELAQLPQVTIGAHSHCHNLLDQIPLEQARNSIIQSRDLLRDWTGQAPRHFAYPNGNHNAAVEQAVAEAGFASATVLDHALCARRTDPFRLSRLAIGRYDRGARFRLRLIGR